jgi:transcriptional regulator with XRE-family HTH domain
MTESARPGSMLRALRLRKGWKLSDVAERTGFPISTLSKIENDKVAVTYDKIARLSAGLGVDIGVFFAEEAATAPPTLAAGRRSIVRKGDGKTIETETYRHLFVATDLLNKHFVPIIAEPFVRSIDEFGEFIHHIGEEFTYVLEGALELHTEIYAPVRLYAGDSIYFDSGIGHAYIDVGDTPLRVLTICSGDESQLMAAQRRNGPSADRDGKVALSEPARPPLGGARKKAKKPPRKSHAAGS